MKILILSDLCWVPESKEITVSEVLKMSNSEILIHEYFRPVKFYVKLIEENEPDLLILAGDITGDGSCGHGYVSSISALLKIAERNKIPTRYLSGNHDEEKYIQELSKLFSDSKYVKNIDGKYEAIDGLRIAGFSFDNMKSRSNFKKIDPSIETDIVFCHCPHGQRMNLFDLNTKTIVTGHYDLKLISPFGKTFVSLENDSCVFLCSYALVEYFGDTQKVHLILNRKNTGELTKFSLVTENGSIVSRESNAQETKSPFGQDFRFVNNIPFENLIEVLQKKKAQGETVKKEELDQYKETPVNRFLKVSKKFITSYMKAE